MGIFNIQTLSIAGFVLSALGNITQFLSYRKLRAQKIETANKEILDSLIPSALEKSIPRKIDINSLINATSKKYNLKENKLHNIDTFYDLIKKSLYSNPAIQTKERDELIDLINEEKETEIIRKIVTHKKKIKEEDEEEGKKEISKEKPTPVQFFHDKKELIFSDNFENQFEWKDYKEGIVTRTSKYSHSGKYSLIKDKNGDPNGGYRKLNKKIDFKDYTHIIFSGWIFRPPVISPNLGDRLSILNENFCGYGFFINHSNNKVLIERRDNGRPKLISNVYNFVPSKGKWYSFEFHLKKVGEFKLILFDENRGIDKEVESYIDTKFTHFDRVAVLGGFPYFIDDLKIELVN